jgi:hypothetical protein
LANKYQTLKTEVAMIFKTNKPEYLNGVEANGFRSEISTDGQIYFRKSVPYKVGCERRFVVLIHLFRKIKESVAQGNEVSYGHCTYLFQLSDDGLIITGDVIASMKI